MECSCFIYFVLALDLVLLGPASLSSFDGFAVRDVILHNVFC